MNMREWALITFTILAQMSVGSFVVLGILHFFTSRKVSAQEADRLSDRALLAIFPILILGILASFGHLGNPINAPRAFSNLGVSWLSREIFFSVLFAIVGCAFAFMQWRKIATFAVRNVIAWIAALIGLALVFSMSQVYMVRTIPVWNTMATVVSFYTTAFLLGSLAIGAAFVASYAFVKRRDPDCAEVQCELLRSGLKGIAIASILLLGVEVITTPLQIAYLASSSTSAAVGAAALMYNQFAVTLALRIGLVFIGAGILGVFLYRNASSKGQEQIMGNLTYAAFALVLASEVIGRFLFYATRIRIGL